MTLRENVKRLKVHRGYLSAEEKCGVVYTELLEATDIAIALMESLSPDITLTVDGNAWCAQREDFIDLMESWAGFGDTPLEAISDLVKNEKKEEVMR